MAPRPRPRDVASRVDYSSNTNQNGSMLLNLPSELKTLIYEFVAIDSKSDLVWMRRIYRQQDDIRGNQVWGHDGKPQPPGIVLACKEMQQDAIPIIYSQTKFTFATILAFDHWLKTISDENLAMAQKGKVQYPRPWMHRGYGEGGRISRELRLRTMYTKKQSLLKAEKVRPLAPVIIAFR